MPLRNRTWNPLLSLMLFTSCARPAPVPDAKPVVVEEVPDAPEIPTAGRAPVDGVDVMALVLRDKLTREAHEDTCCGEGTRTLRGVTWAELDGESPHELIVHIDEYIGEGCADVHHHVYSVRQPRVPRAIGTITEGGYVHFTYHELHDLDADGIDEFIVVGETTGGAPAPLGVWNIVEGQMNDLNKEEALGGTVYLVSDIDSDGYAEIVAMSTSFPDDPRDITWVVARKKEQRVVLDEEKSIKEWLPWLAVHAIEREELERPELTLPILFKLLDEQSLSPGHVERATDAIIAHIKYAPEYERDFYPGLVSWPARSAQREELLKMLRGAEPDRQILAAEVLIRAGGPEARPSVMSWVTHAIELLVAGRGGPDRYSMARVFSQLEPAEVADVCEHVSGALRSGTGPIGAKRDVAWALLSGPMHCLDEARYLLTDLSVPPELRRAAIHALEDAMRHPERAVDWGSDVEVERALMGYLSDPSSSVRADAARALRYFPSASEAVFEALMREDQHDAQWGMGVALKEHGGPYDAGRIVSMLDATRDPDTRFMLHGLIALSTNPDDLLLGLARVANHREYGAYEWWSVYRVGARGEDVQAFMLEDAMSRLSHDDPRIRQAACRILGASPDPKRADVLRSVAGADDVDYVRSTCMEAAGEAP